MSKVVSQSVSVISVGPGGEPTTIYSDQLETIINTLRGLSTTLQAILDAPPTDFNTEAIETQLGAIINQLVREEQKAESYRTNNLANQTTLNTLTTEIRDILGAIPTQLTQMIQGFQETRDSLSELQTSLVDGFALNIDALEAIDRTLEEEFRRLAEALSFKAANPRTRQENLDLKNSLWEIFVPEGVLSFDLVPARASGAGTYSDVIGKGPLFKVEYGGNPDDVGFFYENSEFHDELDKVSATTYKSRKITFLRNVENLYYAIIQVPADSSLDLTVTQLSGSAPDPVQPPSSDFQDPNAPVDANEPIDVEIDPLDGDDPA